MKRVVQNFVTVLLAAAFAAAWCACAFAQSPATATFYGLRLDTGTKTATSAAGAVTLNKASGVVTTEALTTAAGSNYTLTVTDSAIAAADQVHADVSLGSATAGLPVVATITPAAGSVAIVIRNADPTNPLNGSLKVGFFVLKN